MLTIYNGIIYTVNEKFDKAHAFAITDGKIIEVGSTDGILKKYSLRKLLMQKGRQCTPALSMLMHTSLVTVNLFTRPIFLAANSWDETLKE